MPAGGSSVLLGLMAGITLTNVMPSIPWGGGGAGEIMMVVVCVGEDVIKARKPHTCVRPGGAGRGRGRGVHVSGEGKGTWAWGDLGGEGGKGRYDRLEPWTWRSIGGCKH